MTRQAIGGIVLAALAGQALAQVTNLQQIIKRADPVPGIAGEFWPTNPFSDNAAIDNNGNVVFTALLDISGLGTATTANRRGMWHGTPGNLTLLARDGGLAGMPTLSNPNNWVHNSTTNGTGLTSSPLITPNGTIFISSQLNGAGATTTNNTAFWTGPANNLQLVAQRGLVPGPNGVAPGTVGALWNTNLNLGLVGTNRVNNAGQVAFGANLTGGDVTGTTNDSGIWLAAPGNIAMVMREGDTAPTFGDPLMKLGAAPLNGIYLNGAGKTSWVSKVTGGTVPVIPSGASENDNVLFSTLGGSLQAIARQGDSTGLPAGVFHQTPTFGTNPFGLIGQPMSNNNSLFFASTFTGAVTVGVDNAGLFQYHYDTNTNTGATTMLYRRNDPSPLPGANWGLFNFNSTKANAIDSLLLAATMQGPGITSSFDDTLWVKPVGQTPMLIAREGEYLTNFGSVANLAGLPADAVFVGNLTSSAGCAINILNQAVFNATITGTGVTAGVNDRCLLGWDPAVGLMLIARTGTVFDPSMGPATSLGFNGGAGANGEGGSIVLSDTGWLTFRVADNFSNAALYRAQLIPTPGTLALCGFGLLAIAGRRRRR